jgi:nucleotide-binding universal stress UspA family protein
MKTVLVPTDFSKYANAGVKLASQIAGKTGSPMILLHNVSSMVNWEGLSRLEQSKYQDIQLRTDAGERKLNDIVTQELGNDLDVRTIVTHGITLNEIVSKAEALRAELIVMGSHGDEDPDRTFIGSNVQKVIRYATCPVLATRRGFLNKKVEKIVFASQFDFVVHKPFSEIIKMADALEAKIHLLYINTPAHFKDSPTIKREMNEFCSHYPGHEFVMAVYNQRDTVTGILEYCHEINADMVALITRDRRRAAKYLVGITELLVSQTDIPVLSVNERMYEPVLN